MRISDWSSDVCSSDLVKTEWIESGRAKLVFRHYPLDQLALRAAAVADCVKGDGFFGFLDVLFQNQDTWAGSQDPMTQLSQYAALAGLDKAPFEACLTAAPVVTCIPGDGPPKPACARGTVEGTGREERR